MAHVQVFEYLSTDLKKFMDRNGKGPSHPLDPKLIKVALSHQLQTLSFSSCHPIENKHMYHLLSQVPCALAALVRRCSCLP